MDEEELYEMFPDWKDEQFGVAGYTVFAVMAEVITDAGLHTEGVEAEDMEVLFDACYSFMKFCQKHQRKVEIAQLERMLGNN